MLHYSKKSLFIISLALVMVLVLSSCAKLETVEKEEVTPTVKEEVKATPTPEPTAEPTQEPTPEPTATPTPVVEAGAETFGVQIAQSYDSEWDYDNNRVCGSYSFEYPVISDTAREMYPEIATAFDDYYNACSASAKDILVYITDAAKSDIENEDSYMREDRMSIIRADSNLVCMLCNNYSYTGGIHGMYGASSICYDTGTGKQIGLKDIVTDRNAFIDKVYEYLINIYTEDEFIMTDDLRTLIEREYDDDLLCYEVGYDYVAAIFNPYDILPFAYGITYATVPFSGNEAIFNEKYVHAPENYMVGFNLNDGIRGDFNKDGIVDSVVVYKNYCNEYDDFDGITFYLNNEPVSQNFVLDEMCYDADPVFIHQNGKNYIYVTYWFASEDTMTYIYRIDLNNGYDPNAADNHYGNISDTGCIYESIMIKDSCDPEHFYMDQRMDMIGTNFVKAAYRLGNDGLPVMTDSLYEFNYHYELTAKMDINMKSVDSTTGTEGSNVTIPAGTVLRMYKTNGESFVDMYINEDMNSQVRLYVSADNDWNWIDQTADGINLNDAFDGIIYAD